ncbi:MAG: hypothetical protein ACP5P2_02150 [Candidatus Micrarchaeia archaeon]|jgi:predicted transcriptional regulator
MGSFGKLFLKDKQVRAFLTIAESQQEWNISNLAKEANITYVHLSRFISECEKAGLIESAKHGRIKGIKLTQKGIDVANHLSSIAGIISKQEAAKAKNEKESLAEKAEKEKEKASEGEAKQPQ